MQLLGRTAAISKPFEGGSYDRPGFAWQLLTVKDVAAFFIVALTWLTWALPSAGQGRFAL